MFYFYALGTLLCSVALVWMPILNWNTWWWTTVNAFLRNNELCFAWCQSLAFLLLCQKLKQVSEIALKSDFVIRNQGIYYARLIDIVLFVGLFLINVFTLVNIILLCTKTRETKAYMDKFIRIEIISWVASTFSSALLIAAGLYTIMMLRKLYGNDFNKTKGCLTLIVVIFCIAFGTKSIYEWGMYKMHIEKKKELVLEMMQIMVFYMPFVWDLLPICTIFILHS